jgi:hypothetical protein
MAAPAIPLLTVPTGADLARLRAALSIGDLSPTLISKSNRHLFVAVRVTAFDNESRS